MRAPRAFHLFAVHKFRSSPALRSTQNDHGPDWKARRFFAAGLVLGGVNLFDHRVERGCHELMHRFWIMPFHEVGFISIASEELR